MEGSEQSTALVCRDLFRRWEDGDDPAAQCTQITIEIIAIRFFIVSAFVALLDVDFHLEEYDARSEH
jgi:hypothetical protein